MFFSVIILVLERVDHPQKPSAPTLRRACMLFWSFLAWAMLKATAARQIPRFSSQNLQLFSPSKVGFTAHEGHNSTFLGPNAFEIRATHRDDETNIAGSWQIFGSHMITKIGELRTPQLLWRFSSFRWQTLHGISTSFPRLLTCNQSSACAEPSHRAWSVIEPAMERLTDQG